MSRTAVVDSPLIQNVQLAPSRVDVPDGLLRRHLGLPADAEWTGEVSALADEARDWYGEHGRPWSARREVGIAAIDRDEIHLEGGTKLTSSVLAAGLGAVKARALVVVAVSAGPEVDEEIDRRWKDGRPDEATFLNAYAAALTETLRSRAHERLSRTAARRGEIVLPHYSPGYEGWDLGDQKCLHELLSEAGGGIPGPLEVLPSSGLRPAKSTLAVFGVAASGDLESDEDLIDFWTRRASPAALTTRVETATSRRDPPAYAVRERTLELWASRRLTLTETESGRLHACFRLDGTTCSNMGLPLALHYEVELEGGAGTYRVLACRCAPAPGDTGHRSMCSFIEAPERFASAMVEAPDWSGRTLDELLEWTPVTSLSGCLCTRASRDHKWRLVLHTLHYALLKKREHLSS